MTTVLCSYAAGRHVELLDLAEPTFKAYADRWGFEWVREHTATTDRPPSWQKIQMLDTYLRQADTVVWVDADAMIVDLERNILDVATTKRALWMTRHQVEHTERVLPNCGVLVAHRHPDMGAFLDAVWAKEEHINHGWWEQQAMLDVIGWGGQPSGWRKMVGWLGTEWNSMPRHDPHPDPVIVHFSGQTHEQRLNAMRAVRAAA